LRRITERLKKLLRNFQKGIDKREKM
jgi:hypothetical protein